MMEYNCSECGSKKPEDETQILKGRRYCLWCMQEKEDESERRKQRMLRNGKG